MLKKVFIVAFIFIGFGFTNGELEEKFYKAIRGTYEVENFDLKEIEAPAAVNEKLPAKPEINTYFKFFLKAIQ